MIGLHPVGKSNVLCFLVLMINCLVYSKEAFAISSSDTVLVPLGADQDTVNDVIHLADVVADAHGIGLGMYGLRVGHAGFHGQILFGTRLISIGPLSDGPLDKVRYDTASQTLVVDKDTLVRTMNKGLSRTVALQVGVAWAMNRMSFLMADVGVDNLGHSWYSSWKNQPGFREENRSADFRWIGTIGGGIVVRTYSLSVGYSPRTSMVSVGIGRVLP